MLWLAEDFPTRAAPPSCDPHNPHTPSWIPALCVAAGWCSQKLVPGRSDGATALLEVGRTGARLADLALGELGLHVAV